MHKLFFNKQSKVYFLFSEPEKIVTCECCNNQIQPGDGVIYFRFYSNRKTEDRVRCLKCQYNKVITLAEVKQMFSAFFVNVFPLGTVLITPTMQLSSGSPSVFSAATSNEGINSDCSMSVVNDYTKLASRDSWNGASIGRDVSKELAEKDKLIKDDNEPLSAFDKVFSGERCLPNGKPVIDVLSGGSKNAVSELRGRKLAH